MSTIVKVTVSKAGSPGLDGKTAYQYAVESGYTGTEQEFAEDQANFASNATQVREDRDTTEGYKNESLGYKNDAEDARDDAEEAKTIAENASNIAVSAKNDAVSAKNNAEDAKIAAETAQGIAEGARDTAVSASNTAVSAKNDAVEAKGDAENAKTAAESARDTAVSAKNDAVSAKNDAESAKDTAVLAANTAVQAKDDALLAQSAAESARDTAVGARNEAVDARNEAVPAANTATSAKNDAENARDIAVQAKDDAEDARDIAVQAKEDAETARDEAVLAKEAAELAASTIDGSGEVAEGNNKLVTGGEVWENTPRMKPGKNLFDPSKVQQGKLVSNVGTITSAAGWECSDYIPVEPGNYYLSGEKYREGVGFYDSEKTTLRYSNINTGLIQVFENEAFVVFNLKSPSTGEYANVQFEKGDKATPYQPYKKIVIADEVEGLVDALTFVSTSGNSLGLYTSLKDGALSVHTIDGATVHGDAEQKNVYGYSQVFNFTGDFVGGRSRTLNDDVAPLYVLNGTYGGNHGLNARKATITDHGFTNVDIGTEFDKEGVKFYLMSVIDKDNAVFLSEYSGDSLSFSFTPLTNGILTRGAESYTITDVAPFTIYLHDNSLSIDVFVDGYRYDEINTNCKVVDVVEKYTLSNPPSILDAVISRAGQDEPPSFSGTADIQVENIYQFRPNVVLVFNSFRTLNEVRFSNIVAVQAVKLHSTLTEYYIPNSNELNESVDLRKPTVVPWSSSIPPTYVKVDKMPDPLNPPHRVIMYYGNSGFMIGYLLDRGVGADITSYTGRTFRIHNNTGKIYPHTVESTVVGSILPANTVYSSAMYRAYTDLSKTRSGNRLSVFEVPVDDSVFVYIDYSGSMVDSVQLQNTGFSGRKIEVIESKNTQCLSDVYTGSISVIASYVEGETCYLILKL